MKFPLTVSILTATVLWTGFWAGPAHAADIKKRTSIICVFGDTRSLTSFGGQKDGEGKPGKVRSWFTEWLFSDNQSSRSAKIRFLWAPEEKGAPLKISSKDTHHVLIKLMSITRDSVLASSSASDLLTAVGWLFSINFKLEQVMATSVRSNAAGMKGETVRMSCNFTNDTPEVEKPEKGAGLG